MRRVLEYNVVPEHLSCTEIHRLSLHQAMWPYLLNRLPTRPSLPRAGSIGLLIGLAVAIALPLSGISATVIFQNWRRSRAVDGVLRGPVQVKRDEAVDGVVECIGMYYDILLDVAFIKTNR